jgi:hypothetical protein
MEVNMTEKQQEYYGCAEPFDNCANNDETCSLCDGCSKEDMEMWESKDVDIQTVSMSIGATAAKDPKARYYDHGGIETLDIIKAKLTPDQYQGWLLGNVIKYSCRANYKEQFSRDIEKTEFYSAELRRAQG